MAASETGRPEQPLRRSTAALGRFAREHIVLVIAAALAGATMVAVPPDAGYLGYIDWSTLGCLFSVLAVANAFRYIGALDRAARLAIEHLDTPQSVAGALIATTAALSAVVTNDLALIVMLPLAATTLVRAGWSALVPATFAMQSIAANLCGMIAPFGNPQNLYLYSYYELSLGDFLRTMALPFLAATGLIALCSWLLVRRAPAAPARMQEVSRISLGRRRFAAYAALLGLTVLAVFRIVPIAVAVAAVAAVLAFADRRALGAVDYPLLLTFACFFIFAGNMARIPLLSEGLANLMAADGLLATAGASQIISNVPAAVLLSHFTGDWQAVLVGVNIGGAGTFIGSLASLITIQHFMSARKVFPHLRNERALAPKRFLALFGGLNLLFLAALLAICLIAR